MSLQTPSKIRTLQRKLYRKAKDEPEYRFYLLYDKIYREDILTHAYELAKANRGAPGVDGQTFEQIESRGRGEWLAGIRDELRAKRYKPQPVRRVMIPKPGGGERPLGIPTVSAYCTSYNTASESSRDSFRILEERRTHSSNSRSFSPLTVIQYGEPPVSLRARIRPRSIQ
jgi:hypothetical protein